MTVPAAAFAGTLATRIRLAPPRDPEFKGMVERANGFLETSFLPGRLFASPADFNDQLALAGRRPTCAPSGAIAGRPVDLLGCRPAAMTDLPPVAPAAGLAQRVRLGRDYYVRVDTATTPSTRGSIGRLRRRHRVAGRRDVRCDGQVVARHDRCWAKTRSITDPAHAATAAQMRQRTGQTGSAARRRPPPRRRAPGRAAGAARLRRPVRRRLPPPTNPHHRSGRSSA